MMSVNDLFYSSREPVWVVHTPNSGQKGNSLTQHSVHGLHYNSAVELKVPLCCEACEERVKHALLNLSGVESVKCDSFTQRVSVTGTAAPADVLRICKKQLKRSELLQKNNVMASPKW